MKNKAVRRAACIGMMILLVLFALVSLGHLAACHEEADHCPVCIALLKGWKVWLLTAACLQAYGAGKLMAGCPGRLASGFSRGMLSCAERTPVALKVKITS